MRPVGLQALRVFRACGQISGDLDLALSGQAAINERMQVGLGDRGNGRWRTVGIHGLLRNTFI